MTRRTLLVGLAFAGLAAWVSAQGPTAGEQLRMLQGNRELLEDLVEHGLAVAGKNAPLDRADQYRSTTDRLARELRNAIHLGDGDRVAEVCDLLDRVVTSAIVPNLSEARESISPASPDYSRLKEIHQRAVDDVRAIASSIPTDTELGTKSRVKAAREKLIVAAEAFGPTLP
jgi:hypothetical protein